MSKHTPDAALIPMLDPRKNFHLTPEGRPTQSSTMIAPANLLAQGRSVDLEKLRSESQQVVQKLTTSVGRPYYARDGFIIYHGDCIDIMQKLALSNFKVALTVTSPPYNIGKTYESPQNVNDYIAWCTTWISAIHKITQEHGAAWLNLGYLEIPEKGLCVPIPYLLWDKTPFYLLQEVVWHYGAGVSTKTRFCPRNEKWLFYVQDRGSYTFNLDNVRDPNVKYPNQKKNGKLRCNPLGKNPSDVWIFPKVTTGTNRKSKERTGHPAQFPLAVIDRIVKVSSNPLEIVIDPFSGSGSTGIATTGNGRIYVGCEKREDYCQIAAQRHTEFIKEQAQADQQRKLFQ